MQQTCTRRVIQRVVLVLLREQRDGNVTGHTKKVLPLLILMGFPIVMQDVQEKAEVPTYESASRRILAEKEYCS